MSSQKKKEKKTKAAPGPEIPAEAASAAPTITVDDEGRKILSRFPGSQSNVMEVMDKFVGEKVNRRLIFLVTIPSCRHWFVYITGSLTECVYAEN